MALKDVLGQDRAIEILKRSLKINRIPHAYIFLGEEGVGKFFTAINLAKALNCEKSVEDACDSCPSCIDIDRGIHSDVMIIEPEGDQIKIDQIRRAEERIALSVLRGRKKVLIIDKAHMMNISSANALLKTLEEPSEGNVIILISSAQNLLPATVLSRCQRLPFGLPSRKVIEEMLISKGFKEEEAYLAVSLSNGRIGNALKTNQERLKERENFLTLFNSVREPFYKISPMVEGIAKSEDSDLGEILWWGEVWLRDLVVFKVTGDPHLLINQDMKKEIGEVAERFSLYQLQNLFDIIYNTKRFITLRANRQLALEVMMIRLAETFTLHHKRPHSEEWG